MQKTNTLFTSVEISIMDVINDYGQSTIDFLASHIYCSIEELGPYVQKLIKNNFIESMVDDGILVYKSSPNSVLL